MRGLLTRRRLIAAALLGVLTGSPPVTAAAFACDAQDDRQGRDQERQTGSEAALPVTPIDVGRLVRTIGPISFGAGAIARQEPDQTESRPSRVLITSLFVTTAVMQGLDTHSTFKALDAGAVEANPLMRPLVNHRGAFVALKVGMAAGLIYAGHHLYKKNKVAGALALAAVNAAYGLIALRNYDVAREQRAINGR
jgi:hypothetical protein